MKSYKIISSTVSCYEFITGYDTVKEFTLTDNGTPLYWITYYHKGKGVATVVFAETAPGIHKNIKFNFVIELDENNIDYSIDRINKLAVLK